MRRFFHRFGTVLLVVGLVLLAYGAAVLFWRDPITDLYARWQQHRLDAELQDSFAAYRAGSSPTEARDLAANRKLVAAAARRFGQGLERGDPLGRLRIPDIAVRKVVVNGTRWGADLSRGPGKYERTELPGLGRTTGIAGHRTTFGAPFRRIDDLRRGDEIELELPYATFHYLVLTHEIVDSKDWSVIRDRGFDTLMLSACHPLYSSSRRWIVYARLSRVEPIGGAPYTLAGAQTLAYTSGK